jgi:hypothetical protein
MWSLIVVLGLVAVVVLVLVLVAMGMRASRAEHDDDWMSEDDQPRGGRRAQAGKSRGRRAQTDEADEPYGDRRVAGAPMAQLPAAPISEPPRGRSNDEMNDDEYWSTITFDKPKFPWRKESESAGAEAGRGRDPLAPGGPSNDPAPPTMVDQPAIPSGFGQPAPPEPQQLDVPVSRADVTDPGSIPTYHSEPPGYAAEPTPSFGSAPGFGNEPAYGSEPLPSYGSQGQDGFGDDPLNTGERTYTPPPAPAPAAPAPVASAAGADGDRLPSVDELLARIQSDRKKAAQETEAQQYASLADPLNDPLATGERSYGSASTSGGWPANPDPLNTAQPSHGYDGGYGTAASGSGYGNDGYGGQPRQQEDPLGGGYGGSEPSYGSYGSGEHPAPQQPGAYSDFSGSTYNGSGYSGDYSSGQPSETPAHENTTQAYPTSPYSSSNGAEKRTDEWGNPYGDFRR